MIFIGKEFPSAHSVDRDIHWLARAFQYVLVSKIRYQVLVTSQVVTPTSTRAFYLNGVWCWMLLPELSREKTNYIIQNLWNIEVLDMTLIFTTEYQYWPRLPPRSKLVFSGGYHVISNTSVVNNCIMFTDCICMRITSFSSLKATESQRRFFPGTTCAIGIMQNMALTRLGSLVSNLSQATVAFQITNKMFYFGI